MEWAYNMGWIPSLITIMLLIWFIKIIKDDNNGGTTQL